MECGSNYDEKNKLCCVPGAKQAPQAQIGKLRKIVKFEFKKKM